MKNDWATISLYADKGDLSFREKKEFLMLYTLYEGDPRRNANQSVISFTFDISTNDIHV